MTSPYRFDPRRHSTHGVLVRIVPEGSKVLDAGCESGYLGRALTHRGCSVWGIDANAAAISQIPDGVYRDARVVDLDDVDALPYEERSFDVVLAADVLEHLRSPERGLSLLLRYLVPGGLAIVSLPNVAHVSVRMPLMLGRFTYRDAGILDRSHRRLFTFASARYFVESTGLRVVRELSGSNRFGALLNGNIWLGRLLRGALAYNIIVVARADGPGGSGRV